MPEHSAADVSNRSSVEVVISQYEIDGNLDRRSELREEGSYGIGLPDIASNEQSVEVFTLCVCVKNRPPVRREEVQMNIG